MSRALFDRRRVVDVAGLGQQMAKGPGPTHIQPRPPSQKARCGNCSSEHAIISADAGSCREWRLPSGALSAPPSATPARNARKASPLSIAHPIHLPARVPIAGVAARIMPATTHVIYLPSGVAIKRVALGLRWRRDAKYGRRRYASTYAKCGKHRASTDPPLREDTSISERERFVDVAGSSSVMSEPPT